MKHHRRAEPVIKDLFKERISVSLFAGCGGACVGMRAATGNEVDVAINHDSVCPHPMRAVSAANVRPWKAAA